jgi:hypothetical protein
VRRIAAVLAAAAVLSSFAAAQAGSGFGSTGATTVGVQGEVVTITVKIDLLLGGLGETELPEGAQEAADGLAREIADYWNAGLQRYDDDCIQLRLVVEINALPTGALQIIPIRDDRVATVTSPGRHVVIWGVNNFGNAAPPVTLDPYDDDGYAPPGEDYTSPFEHELEATWSPQLEDARDFAHEFGHLLGFGDDYDENGEGLPGREGTLMADGDLIDESLAGRLAALARGADPDVPECEEEIWEGTIASTVTTPPPGGPCGTTIPIQGTVRLEVEPDGDVSGRYEVDGCGVTEPTAEFTGTATEDAFHFPQLIVFTNGEQIPKVGPTEAQATLTNLQGTARWVTTWTLTCTTCETSS